MSTRFSVTSPDDCFVTQVATQDQVKQGDVIAVLYSPKLESFLTCGTSLLALLDIAKRKFTDGRSDQTLASEKSSLSVIETKADMTEKISAEAQLNYQNGVGLPSTFQTAIASDADAQVELNKQQLTVDQFQAGNRDQLDSLTEWQNLLSKEMKLLQDLKDRMTIKAPFAGTVELQCYSGGFQKKGTVLALFTKH